jgi:predicted peptidase
MKLFVRMILAAGLVFAALGAQAQVYKPCDNCTNPLAVAKTAGTGEPVQVVVIDYPQNVLYAYRAWYDYELQRSMAVRTAVPADVSATYNRLVTMAKAGGTHTIYFDNRTGGGFGNIQFPSGYEHVTAYDIVTDATLRSRFLEAAAKEVIGSDSAAMRNFAAVFYQIIQKFNLNGDTLILVLADGSQVIVRVDKDNILKAQLISAEDKHDNPMPLPGLPDGGVQPGSYDFNNDTYALDQWLYSAALMGVKVTDGHGRAVVCAGSGTDMVCWVQIY